MKFLERLQAARKAFWGGGDWVSSDLPGTVNAPRRVYWIPGTRINWDTVTGDLWNCPAVQACLSWETRNGPQASPIVQEQQRDGSWQPVPGHPLVDLLMEPNQDYDWSVLLAGILLSLDLNGNNYLAIERTRGGKVGELWWLPHSHVEMPQKAGEPWIYWGATRTEIPEENMVRQRFGIDPDNPKLGLAPLASSKRGVYTLQQAANYGANVLKNFGTIGMIISGKSQEVTFDPDLVSKEIKDKTTGDNVGGIVAIEAPIDVDYPGATPEKMALEALEDRPESQIAALIGIPAQVVGLHVGRLSKTYANQREAREAAWEEKMMPTLELVGGQVGRRLLPEFSTATAEAARREEMKRFRLTFDYSRVRPLQPDLDALHTRARLDWVANISSLADWKTAVGQTPDKGDELIFYRDRVTAPPLAPPSPAQGMQGSQEGKRMDWAERMVTELEAMHALSA